MEEYTQITLDEWMQWKEDIRQKLTETAGNFVYIGYRLKQIRDSGMFDGAADIFEFAEREYGLGKSTVSRFIAINEKYSEGGNSLYLREEFRNFSSSKLSEMLTLTDAECQLITDRTTIKEIRELKNFGRQQADEEQEQEAQRTPLEKCIIDFFSGKRDMLNSVMGCLGTEEPGYREAEEIMNPSGQGSHKKGIVFLFFYDWITGVKYKLMAQPEPVSMTWPDFLNEVYRIYAGCSQEDIWNDFYGEKEHKKELTEDSQETVPPESNQGFAGSVATSQQNAECGGETEDNIQNYEINDKEVTGDGAENVYEIEDDRGRADTGNTETIAEDDADTGRAAGKSIRDADVEEKENAPEVHDEEQQAEGQMDITQFKEYMPEQRCDTDAVTGYLYELKDILENIYRQAEQAQYSHAEELFEAAKGTLRKIIEVSGMAGEPEGQRTV